MLTAATQGLGDFDVSGTVTEFENTKKCWSVSEKTNLRFSFGFQSRIPLSGATEKLDRFSHRVMTNFIRCARGKVSRIT
jgi:hypothetical protein